jgi:ATP-dependent Lon protease
VVVQITGTNWPRPAYTLLVTGICRFRVETLLQENPYPIAMVTQLDKLPGDETGPSKMFVIELVRKKKAKKKCPTVLPCKCSLLF